MPSDSRARARQRVKVEPQPSQPHQEPHGGSTAEPPWDPSMDAAPAMRPQQGTRLGATHISYWLPAMSSGQQVCLGPQGPHPGSQWHLVTGVHAVLEHLLLMFTSLSLSLFTAPEVQNLQEARFNLVHGYGWFSPWWMLLGRHIMAEGLAEDSYSPQWPPWDGGEKPGTRTHPSRSHSSDSHQ